MKWKPIGEIPSELVDKDLLLRIETDDKGVVYAVGQLSADRELLYVLNYAGYDNYFDPKKLCNVCQLRRYGIMSIQFIDPKEIEL